MTDLVKNAEDFVQGSRTQWSKLVDIALGIGPKQVDKAADRLASLAGVGRTNVKRKLEAIRFKSQQGWAAEVIKAEGQAATLSTYVKTKVKARTDPLVPFPHKLTPAVRDAFEVTCRRVGKILGLKTWDEVIEFMNSDYLTTVDEEIIHRAGELNNGTKQDVARRVDRLLWARVERVLSRQERDGGARKTLEIRGAR